MWESAEPREVLPKVSRQVLGEIEGTREISASYVPRSKQMILHLPKGAAVWPAPTVLIELKLLLELRQTHRLVFLPQLPGMDG
jgi:hypothetical protein